MNLEEIRAIQEAYSKVYQEVEENRQMANDPEGTNSGHSKQPDPSKDGFTGIGNMSIAQIKKLNDKIAKEKNAKNEEVEVETEEDLFDYILEYLVAEGYADTNENAIAIMSNMSEEWRESILDEAYVDYRKGKLSGGRSPKQALKSKEELNKARAANRANYDLSKPENPDAAKFKARAAKAGKVGAEMDAHTSTAGKIGKALTPGLGNRTGASPRVSYGEPNTDRHQLARHARGQSSTKG